MCRNFERTAGLIEAKAKTIKPQVIVKCFRHVLFHAIKAFKLEEV